MEEQHPTIRRLRRMQNKPPLPPEATPGCRQKHKKMQTTKSSTSTAITSGPPSKIDPPESSFPVSTELEITSPLAGESDIVETKAPKISLPEVIELDYTESETIQPDVPQLFAPITSGPSSSFPLSHTQPQTIYLGPDSELLASSLMSIEKIPQEEPQPSSPIRVGAHFYQVHPFPSPHTPSQAPLFGSFPFNSPLSFS